MGANGIADRFTREDLDRFKALLLERRALLLGDLHAVEQEESSSDLAHASSHLADHGSDRAASDLSLGYRESASGEIQEIDAALERMAEGLYGMCEACGEPIPSARLEAIPYTQLCVPCKRSEEA